MPPILVARIAVALLLFGVFQLGVLWLQQLRLGGEHADLADEVQRLEKKRQLLEGQILTLERDSVRMERKVEQLQDRLRDVSSLLVGEDGKTKQPQPLIFFVTPTYRRPVQRAELTRLGHTLAHVPNLLWLVVEDADEQRESIAELLRTSRVRYVHLNARTPAAHRLTGRQPSWKKARGVVQRNAALAYLRTQYASEHDARLYFGDDDNTYARALFYEIRKVKKLGVWPVGLVGGQLVEGPRCENHTVKGWTAGWHPERPFAIDMAGFAVHWSAVLRKPEAGFSFKVGRGYQESHFLKDGLGLTVEDAEPMAGQCSDVLVWHTRTERPKLDEADEKRAQDDDKLTELERRAV